MVCFPSCHYHVNYTICTVWITYAVCMSVTLLVIIFKLNFHLNEQLCYDFVAVNATRSVTYPWISTFSDYCSVHYFFFAYCNRILSVIYLLFLVINYLVRFSDKNVASISSFISHLPYDILPVNFVLMLLNLSYHFHGVANVIFEVKQLSKCLKLS